MNKSEFGKVLEREGWEQSDLADYWDSPCGKWLAYPDTLDGEVALFDKKRFGVIAFATNEHHVLRIVASIEGTDRWRSVDSVPENEDAWYEVLVGDPEEGPHMITPAKLDGARWVDDEGELIPHQPYITAWRPYSPANWGGK